MEDIMRDLRIKARDNGRLPVPVRVSTVEERFNHSSYLRRAAEISGMLKSLTRALLHPMKGPGW